MTTDHQITIRSATARDVPLILSLIREIAEYEKLAHEVVATEELIRRHLFPSPTPPTRPSGPIRDAAPAAEVVIGLIDGQPQGFALFFQNFSTFLARPGIYLEDLFVRPASRGQGLGKALFRRVAQIAVERGAGRMEWSVLDWNTPAIDFYRAHSARPMDEWTVFRLTGPALAEVGKA